MSFSSRCRSSGFTRLDPGEVAVCFGDDGTWCPLYKHDSDGQIHQEYSDGEETVSSAGSDDDFLNLAAHASDVSHLPTKQITKANSTHSHSSSSTASSSRASSPFFNALTTNPLSAVQSFSDYEDSGEFSLIIFGITFCCSVSFPLGSNFSSYPSMSDQQYSYWPTQLTQSESFLLSHQEEHF